MMMRSRFRVALVMTIFFVISLLTNIIGPIIPDVIRDFQLSLTLAAFLPFSFFVAYAVMSIPAGMIVEKYGEKIVFLGSFGIALAGTTLVCIAPSYPTAVMSLFLIGLGMAALQVAINPLLRVSGGEENFAFNGVLSQLVFGVASTLSPLVYSHFAKKGGALAWSAIYWLLSAILVAIIILIEVVPIPRVVRTAEESAGTIAKHAELLRRPIVWLFFLGIFAYVGLEQSLSNWMSQFLSLVHGIDPQTDGARAVSRFWGAMTIGCVVGLALLKLVDSRKVLLGAATSAALVLTSALLGSREIATVAFPLMGFCLAVMWSIIFSLALNSLDRDHGTFSGILCTGIVGGALLPLVVGGIGDAISLRVGLAFLYVPLVFIFSIGVWARPMIANKTIRA